MDPVCTPLVIIGVLLGLVLVGGIGIITLIKLGVLAQYAVKEEEPDMADYSLDESHESGEK
ncbi:MAG: hypothetical protein PVF47_05450 [Anaerolineae bacterium]|jgi:hypothetical protein